MGPDYVLFFTLSLSTSMAGLFLNLFILAVSGQSWWKGGSPGDVILSISGLSNVIREIFLSSSSIIYCFYPELSLSKIFYMITYGAYVPISCCTSWMNSWLCIFYCIKITHFRGVVFRFFKSQLSRLLYGLILASVLLSYALLSPFMGYLQSTCTTDNCTLHYNVDYLPYQISSTAMDMLFFWFGLPFILIMVSLGLTLTSLTMHVYRMKKSASFSFAQIKGHLSAMTTMTFLLCLYTTFYISQVILTLNNVPTSSMWRQVGLQFHYMFSLVQAIILILGNPKLTSVIKELTKCQKKEEP